MRLEVASLRGQVQQLATESSRELVTDLVVRVFGLFIRGEGLERTQQGQFSDVDFAMVCIILKKLNDGQYHLFFDGQLIRVVAIVADSVLSDKVLEIFGTAHIDWNCRSKLDTGENNRKD